MYFALITGLQHASKPQSITHSKAVIIIYSVTQSKNPEVRHLLSALSFAVAVLEVFQRQWERTSWRFLTINVDRRLVVDI